MLLWFTRAKAALADTIIGSVTDPTGAVIPGAKVTLAYPTAGFCEAVSSDQDGRYRFCGHAFGRSELMVRASGFHKTQYAGDLQASGPLVVDVHFNSVESASVQIKVEDGDLEGTTSSLTTLYGQQISKAAPRMLLTIHTGFKKA